jgi:Flp pilus assembly protein TadG
MLRLRVVFSSLPRRLREFQADQNGVSAVEFAMLLPLMLTLYLGTVEVSQAVSLDRKVTLSARSVADLVARATNVKDAEMGDILSAAAAVTAPFPSSTLRIVVSSVYIDNNGAAKVDWSDASPPAAKHAQGDPVTLPAALVIKNSYLVWSEVQYAYTPTLGYVLTGTLNLTDQKYMRPRLSDRVTRSAT